MHKDLIQKTMADHDTNGDAMVQVIGFLGVGDQGKYTLYQKLFGATLNLQGQDDRERKGIYLYDKPQMHIDSHGRKIINYILDVDECVDFKLLSIVPLLCSHLVYLNVNQ